MKKLFGILVLGLIMSTAANAQSTTYERVGKQIKMVSYFEGTDQIKEVGFFKDGKAHGQWTEYDQNGQVRIEATYVDGNKEGVWFVWSEDRNTLFEVNYLNNRVADMHSWSLEERNLHVER